MSRGREKIYVATWTTFTDDYKCRYGNWSYSKQPALFSTQEYAEEYLTVLMREKLWEHDIEYFEENFPKYVKIDKDGDKYIDLSQTPYDELDSILACSCEGEFVPVTVEWNITEQELDTDRVLKKRKK